MRNFKDESFIAQYLSPRVIRQLKLFAITDDDEDSHIEINSIHNTEGYQKVRHRLADQYNLGSIEPNLQIYNIDVRGDRSMTLRHYQYNRRPLASSVDEVLKHLTNLWGFDVKLETISDAPDNN
jgi:spore cortex formation protein SpoVR/YcgB (stage V sporulation)